MALHVIEGQLKASESRDYGLLASEKVFNLLDLDGNRSLTLEEALADHELVKAFSSSDLDKNGQINIAEYFIYSGEATAAGNETSLQELLE